MADDTRKGDAPSAFAHLLKSRDPLSIQQEVFVRLEQERLDRIAATQRSASVDHKTLAKAMAELAELAAPERLGRLGGLLQLIDHQATEADSAADAIRRKPSVEAGGWLALGRVREGDGSSVEDGQVSFVGGSESASHLLKPVKIGADGSVRVMLDARTVAELTRAGPETVSIVALVGDRRVQDMSPAGIVPNGVHQFDLVLPAKRTN